MRFIGIDLAWSARNRSGGAVIDGAAHAGTLIAAELLHDDDSIVAFVERFSGDDPAIVAIDAPLRVPNQRGRRAAEAELGRVFARYHAGAHPANRSLLAVDGVVRGEALTARLAARGFVERAEVAAGAAVRQVLEVFPHPAMIALFDLDRIIPYKARPRRSREIRQAAFDRYRAHLRALRHADPALHVPDLLDRDLRALNLARLKDEEDLLDGLMCAYIAHYLWRWGMQRAQVFGSPEHGTITTPIPRLLWRSEQR